MKRVARGMSERKRGDDARKPIGIWDTLEGTEGVLPGGAESNVLVGDNGAVSVVEVPRSRVDDRNGFLNNPSSDFRRRPNLTESIPHPSTLLLTDHPFLRNPIDPASKLTVDWIAAVHLAPTSSQLPVIPLQPHPVRSAPLL